MHNTHSPWILVSNLLGTWTPRGAKQDDPSLTLVSPPDLWLWSLHLGKFRAWPEQSLNRWWYAQVSPSNGLCFAWFQLCMQCQCETCIQWDSSYPKNSTKRSKTKGKNKFHYFIPGMNKIIGNACKNILVDHGICLPVDNTTFFLCKLARPILMK